MRRWLVLGVLALTACSSAAAVKPPPYDARADVKITTCGYPAEYPESYNTITIAGEVINHGTAQADYVIELAATSPNGKTQLSTTSARVYNLEPGQRGTFSVDGPSARLSPRCIISAVTRT